jgi:hypothetical protein
MPSPRCSIILLECCCLPCHRLVQHARDAEYIDKSVIGPWLDTCNFACFWSGSLLKLLFLCNSTGSW